MTHRLTATIAALVIFAPCVTESAAQTMPPERYMELARSIFVRYRDKDFSFTDCTSFAVMRQLRLTEVLTLDDHFSQMGFTVLPRPD